MPNKAKHPPQTPEEMTTELAKKRATSKLYKEKADAYKAVAVSALINGASAQLKESEDRGSISLSDFDAVKEQTFAYLKACEATGTIPSMSGLSTSLGYSRQAIYDLIKNRSTPKTSDWLERCRDMFSDVLAQASLQNNANNIVAIFLQKALYGLRESVELVVSPKNPLGDNMSPEDVRKYADSLPAPSIDDVENN